MYKYLESFKQFDVRTYRIFGKNNKHGVHLLKTLGSKNFLPSKTRFVCSVSAGLAYWVQPLCDIFWEKVFHFFGPNSFRAGQPGPRAKKNFGGRFLNIVPTQKPRGRLPELASQIQQRPPLHPGGLERLPSGVRRRRKATLSGRGTRTRDPGLFLSRPLPAELTTCK
jgi:hypothetical protein